MSDNKYGLDFSLFSKGQTRKANKPLGNIGGFQPDATRVYVPPRAKPKEEEVYIGPAKEEKPKSSKPKAKILNAKFIPNDSTDFNKDCAFKITLELDPGYDAQITAALWAKYKNREYDAKKEVKLWQNKGIAEGKIPLYYIEDYYNDVFQKNETSNNIDYFLKIMMKGAKDFAGEALTMPVKTILAKPETTSYNEDPQNESSANENEALFISETDGKKIVDIAKAWVGTPYITGGQVKTGADCSGSVNGIYKEAGFPFTRCSSYEFINDPNFKPAPDNKPQVGDVGYWPGHLMIYDSEAGVTNKGEQANGWSASHPRGPGFNVARHQWFDKHYKTDVKWYRYIKKN